MIPVAIGLLWYPALRRTSKRWLAFLLAFTVGLLAFLLVDTVAEGLELAGATAAALDTTLRKRRSTEGDVAGPLGGLLLAYLIAGGIGLHNTGEGLAVGASLATGEVALGTFLIVGFALHNTTEGLAIVAPLGDAAKRPALRHFVALGALAGAPASGSCTRRGF